MKRRYGTLYGVGIGPGDPELITLKGHKILQEAPTIFIPKKSSKNSSFAFSIVKNFIDQNRQEIVELIFPMTDDIIELNRYWETAVGNIYNTICSGDNCAFITEGDPFFYSTFLHIYKTFRRKYPFIQMKVIPGIMSMNASSCKALFPLTEGNEKIAILPASYHIEELRDIINRFDTIVLLKINSVINKIIEIVEDFEPSVKIIFIQRCGTEEEQITMDIGAMRRIRPNYLSLIIIKKVDKVDKNV